MCGRCTLHLKRVPVSVGLPQGAVTNDFVCFYDSLGVFKITLTRESQEVRAVICLHREKNIV